MPRDGNGRGNPGFLANSGDDGWISSAGKGLATAAIKGVSHIPGIVGDVRDLVAMGTGALQSTPFVGNGRNMLDNIATQVQAARNLPGIGMIPNGEDIAAPILRQTGEYKPESGGARAAMAGIEAITGGVNPVSLARGLARGTVMPALREMTTAPNMLIAGTSGAAGDAVGDATGNPLLGAAAGAGTGALTAVASNTGRAIRNARSDAGRAETADRIVGQIAREAATDPDAARAAMAATAAPRPGADVPGLRLTAAQASNDAGLGGLESRAVDLDGKGGAAQTLSRQVAENRALVDSEAARLATANTDRSPDVDVRGSYGISGDNPKADANVAARQAFTRLENARHADQSAAWKAPELGNTGVWRRRSVEQINDFIDGLGEVRRKQFPADIRALINTLNQPDAPRSMPFKELQDLRSAILEKSRNARNSVDPINTKDLDDAAQRVAEIMTDRSNVMFGDSRGAIPAWERARDLTRRYYEDFPTREMGGKLAKDGKISEGNTIDAILAGGNGPQNLRDLQAISGLDLSPQVGDWAVAQLTRNGTDIVTPQQVANFMADSKMGAVIAQVPGLDMRLRQIAMQAGESAQMAAQRQAAANLYEAVGRGPEQLLRVIERNRRYLGEGTAAGDRAALNALESSARKISRLPGGGPSGTATLDDLADGRILDIVMGKLTGKVAASGAGAVAGKMAGAMSGLQGAEMIAGMAGAAVGATKNTLATAADNLVSKIFYGTTKEDATRLLQRAVGDPELMAALMQKPSPEAVKSFGELAGRALQGAGPGAYQGARTGAQSGINELVVSPPRMAAGGFVADVARQAVQHFDKGGPIRGALAKVADTLFDYSRLNEVPKIAQTPVPRYEPPRGVPGRVQDVIDNKDVRDQMLQTIQQGADIGGAKWYNADPLREEFVRILGSGGEGAFKKYMDMVAATSPRSDVPTNVRNASYYYQRLMNGEGLPAIGDKNPKPYGHLAQKNHQRNAIASAGDGWDPMQNPKPASFAQNLTGNQEPVTVDTHAFRLPSILARDPRFLVSDWETAYRPGSRFDTEAFNPRVKMVTDKQTGELKYDKKGEPKSTMRADIDSGYKRGLITMDEAAGTPAWWDAQPKKTEYGALERYYQGLGRELGLTPAQTQASAWVGGGKITGLASDESKPFLRVFEDRIQKTAKSTGMDPRDVLQSFIRGEIPLHQRGGRVSAR